jgi:hypothetical protein
MRPFAAGCLAALVLAAQAAPARGQGAAADVHLGFIGDAGTGDSKQRAVKDQMVKDGPSMVFLLGDNVYAEGSRRDIQSRFDDIYAPLLQRGVVFHAALGNHDVTGCEANPMNPLPADAGAYIKEYNCNVPYHLEHTPFGYVLGRRYYSVAIPVNNPLVEVFVLDSNTLKGSQSKLLLREDTAQLQWLDQALGASRARWKIVTMHHPTQSPTTSAKTFFLVPIGGGRTREFQLDQQLTPILLRHHVDAVFAGHNHFYARMVPKDGIRYFVSGGGGRKTYGFSADPQNVAAGGDYYHFVSVHVTPATFTYRAIDSTGAVRDSGWWAKGDAADHPLTAAGAAAAR